MVRVDKDGGGRGTTEAVDPADGERLREEALALPGSSRDGECFGDGIGEAGSDIDGCCTAGVGVEDYTDASFQRREVPETDEITRVSSSSSATRRHSVLPI